MARPIRFKLAPINASTNNVCAAQTTGGAGNLSLNGSTAGTIVASSVLNTSQSIGYQLQIASTGNLSGVNFTVTGVDANNQAISETIAGPNNSTVYTSNYYAQVSSIAVNGAVGTNVTVGTSNRLASVWLPVNRYTSGAIVINIEDTGTVTYTVQECWDNILEGDSPSWYPVAGLTNIAVTSGVPSEREALASPDISGLRLITGSYNNGATVTVDVLHSSRTFAD